MSAARPSVHEWSRAASAEGIRGTARFSVHECTRALRGGKSDFTLDAVALDDDRVGANLMQGGGVGDGAVQSYDVCGAVADTDDGGGMLRVECEDAEQLHLVVTTAVRFCTEQGGASRCVDGGWRGGSCGRLWCGRMEDPRPPGEHGDEQHDGGDGSECGRRLEPGDEGTEHGMGLFVSGGDLIGSMSQGVASVEFNTPNF